MISHTLQEELLGKPTEKIPHFVMVTGISGSGKSTALNVFEDHGYFVIDNIPPSLLPQLMDMLQYHDGAMKKGVAVGIDVRGNRFLEKLPLILKEIPSRASDTKVLFFDAEDEEIFRRYETTRRQHPFRGLSLSEAVNQERQFLIPLKALSDKVIDTSHLSIQNLQNLIVKEISKVPENAYSLEIFSFGFKYGEPKNCNFLFDVRFLPNPFYYDELRYYTGKDTPVQKFVFQYPETGLFFETTCSLISNILPYYLTKNKSIIRIAIGCTGGRHRSVAMVERMGAYFNSGKISVHILHRDIHKEEY